MSDDPSAAREALSLEALIATAAEGAPGWSLVVGEDWLQGRSWYGGLQLAFAMHAARREAERDDPVRSLHSAFLAPLAADTPTTAQAETVRAGRAVTQVRAWLEQGGRRCFELLALFGAARESKVRKDSDQPAEVDRAGGVAVPEIPGVTPAFLRHYELRWLAGPPPYSGAREARATLLARPAAAVPYTETEFLALTDVIPPPVISLLPAPAPVSSMNCAVELIRPEIVYGTRQWIRFEAELHDTHSGYGWQTARLRDEGGRLLAMVHQSVAVFG